MSYKLMVTAAIAVLLIVGIVAFLTGGATGESFAINAFTAPAKIYRNGMFNGFEYGPYQTPFEKSNFLKAKALCDPNNHPSLQINFNRNECCMGMCSDICRSGEDPTPGLCINTCVRGCTLD